MTTTIETPPLSRITRIRNGLTGQEWARLGLMVAVIIGLYVLGFLLLTGGIAKVGTHLRVGEGRIFGFGTGILALTLGMRHAFDADHISAIDNTTRKLMAEGKRPLSVGFFFSLGHSTVVFVLAVILNFGIKALNRGINDDGSSLHTVTGIIGTSVSGTFLYIIAILNLIILVSILRVFRDMRRGVYNDAELEAQLNKRGLMNRFFGPLARRIDTPWKMYPIGFLFGLGFDTTTEVALLVLSGTAVAGGLPFYAVLSLPLLFAAGMSTFDTTDGMFMNFAYGWAFAKPVRKVFYNITITGLSVLAALVIGTIEILGLLASDLNLSGGFWDFFANFNINHAGYGIVGLFVVTWIIALSIWHFGHIEERWSVQPASAGAEAQRQD